MPWQSSRSFRPIERLHYTARCECRIEQEVCVRKLPKGSEAETEAVRKFFLGGWHADGLAFGRKSPDQARWLCPKCAKAERRS